MAFAFRKKREELICGQVLGKAGAFIIHKSEHVAPLIFEAAGYRGFTRTVTKSILEQIAENPIEARRISYNAPVGRIVRRRSETEADVFVFECGRKFLDG